MRILDLVVDGVAAGSLPGQRGTPTPGEPSPQRSPTRYRRAAPRAEQIGEHLIWEQAAAVHRYTDPTGTRCHRSIVEWDVTTIPVADDRGHIGGRIHHGVVRMRTDMDVEATGLLGPIDDELAPCLVQVTEVIKPRLLDCRLSDLDQIWGPTGRLGRSRIPSPTCHGGRRHRPVGCSRQSERGARLRLARGTQPGDSRRRHLSSCSHADGVGGRAGGRGCR